MFELGDKVIIDNSAEGSIIQASKYDTAPDYRIAVTKKGKMYSWSMKCWLMVYSEEYHWVLTPSLRKKLSKSAEVVFRGILNEI